MWYHRAVVTPETIGRHTLWRLGDMLSIRYIGPITLSDVQAERDIFADVYRETGNCYLIADMSECTGIEPEARRYLANWSKDNPHGTIEGTAIHGVSFAMRAITTLTLNAIRFLSKNQPMAVVFVRDEAAARAWIDEQRALKISRRSTATR